MIKIQNKKANKKNKNQQRSAAVMQLTKNINLLDKRTSAVVNITFPCTIWTYTVSGLYSFTNNSDTRLVSFNQIASASEFTTFASAYTMYKISSCSVIINPTIINTSTTAYPMLHVSCEPEDSSLSNPNNSNFITRDQNHLFSPYSTAVKSVTFTFPSVGLLTNIWTDTSTLPSKGAIYIGSNNATGFAFGSNQLIFDCLINLQIHFAAAQ